MLRAALILVLPLIVTVGGADLLNRVTQHKDGLNLGLYSADSMRQRWRASSAKPADRLASERWFLQLDLAFPLVYGGALMMGLLVAWHTLGRPFSPLLLLAPVFIVMAADWTENLIQLSQIESLLLSDKGPSDSAHLWMRIAGVATSVKWLALLASFVELGCLAWRCRDVT